MAEQYRVMISSTTRDMVGHRQRALDACLRLDLSPLMMEHLPPSPDDAVRVSLDLVDQAEVYVLVLGLRYGEIPSGYEKSYTHLEWDRAIERGIPVLALLSGPDHHFTETDIDLGAAGDRVVGLRAEVRCRGVSYFSSPENLGYELIHALSDIRSRLPPPSASTPPAGRPDPPPAPFVFVPYTLLQTSEVVGRQQELGMLTDWVSAPGSDVHRARVLVLHAIGGMGKSAVAWKWFHDIAPQELPTLAGRVWWSFYETNARFDDFVLRTLGYVTGAPEGELRQLGASEREEWLLGILDREPNLVVLDGVERLLLAYRRSDASRLADDDLDASRTGRPRLLDTVDPRAGVFLRRLAGLHASRVLITSRLVPRDLQRDTAEPVPGVRTCLLGGLTDTDAVALWRQSGVTGSRAELVELFATFGNYPLLIRVLAGEVDRFRPAPRDFAAWRQANPGFDQFSLPLVQRRAQVLEYALGRLTEPESRVLHTVAAFRSPVAFPTLVALLVGDACATQADLDRVLTALEDRDLLGWDRVRNRYDLHPVVRAVAWSSLGPDARHNIDLRRVSCLGEAPEIGDTAITSVDDLSGTIELYHTLVRLGRLNDAIELLDDRIFDALTRLGGYRYLAELARIIMEDPDWLHKIASEGVPRDAEIVCGLMGIGYQFAGDPGRALDSYDLVPPAQLTGDLVAAKLLLQSMALDQCGRLAEAERCARAALAHPDLDEFVAGNAMTALGSVLLHRGLLAEGAAWLADYRTTLGRATIGELSPDYLPLHTLGWAALHRGDVAAAQAFANRLDGHAATSNRTVHLVVCAMLLRGAVAGRQGDEGRAGELLSGGLADARETGLGELEIVGLTQLAEWHLRGRRLPEARDHAREAAQLAERAGLRLRRADALNVLSRVERADGNTEAASQAAHAAYLQAWCDGPPFSYAAGLDDARASLSAVGAPEPGGLGFELGEPFPGVPFKPTPPDVSLDSISTAAELPQIQVIAAIERLGWAAVDPVVTAELDAIFDSSVAAPIRAAALRALARIETDDERRRARVQRAARDQAEEVRAAALPLLDHQTHPPAATVLWSIAERDPAPMVRLAALPLLAERDSAEAFAVIGRIARQDGDPEVRMGALTVLARARDGIVRARLTLLPAVEADSAGWVRVHAAELVTGLEPRAHDALLRRRAGADPDPRVRERLLMLLAGARWTWLWRWPWFVLSGGPLPPRGAATIELGVGVQSFLEEHASVDPDVLVRVAARLLVAAAHPDVPPGVLLLGEFRAAPPSDHAQLGIALMAAGGLSRDPAVVARLSELLESEESEESEELRLMLAGGLFCAGQADAEPALRKLLRAADRDIRRIALFVLARDLEKPKGRLLTKHVDGIPPRLDPLEPITAARIARVAEQIGQPIDEVRQQYVRLAAIFDLGDWITD